MSEREQWEVYWKALASTLVLLLINVLVERQFEHTIRDRVLCWACTFAVVQTALLLLLSLSLFAFRTYARLKENLHEQIRPAIRDRVSALAFEGESWSVAVPAHGLARHVLEESLAAALASVKAAGRDRLAHFAMEHGFTSEWKNALASASKGKRKRAVTLLGLISRAVGRETREALFAGIHDQQSEVRAEACRALLASGDRASIEQVFEAVLEDSLLMRALLADDLKRHAGHLLTHTIPYILETSSPEKAARCFEILIAWKRAIPSLDLSPWLQSSPDELLGPLLLRLLPYVVADDSAALYISEALESADSDVRAAAAEAAGDLKFVTLIPRLEAVLGEERRLALMAAHALAQLGDTGVAALERNVVGANRRAAAVAMEALEHTTTRY